MKLILEDTTYNLYFDHGPETLAQNTFPADDEPEEAKNIYFTEDEENGAILLFKGLDHQWRRLLRNG